MLHLPTDIECYIKLAHLQCVITIAIHKTVSLKHINLEMDVHIPSHGDSAPIIKTRYCLDDVNHDNIAHTPVQQCLLDYHRYQGVSTC
jgi:hypothetical protein